MISPYLLLDTKRCRAKGPSLDAVAKARVAHYFVCVDRARDPGDRLHHLHDDNRLQWYDCTRLCSPSMLQRLLLLRSVPFPLPLRAARSCFPISR